MDAEKISSQEGKEPVIPGTLIVGWALPTPVVSTTSSLGPDGLCCAPGPPALDGHGPGLTWFMHQTACELRCSVVSYSLWPPGLKHARLFCPWSFPGKNTGMGCHFLLQGIFLTQGSNIASVTSPAFAGEFFTASTIWEAHVQSLSHVQEAL